MFLFGPATVTLDGVNLGDTIGGGSISFNYVEWHPIGSLPQKAITGGNGKVNFYHWTNSITVTGTSGTELDSGELIFSGNNFTLTLYDASLRLPDNLSIGTFDQQPFTATFVFGPDSSENIIKME